MVFAASKPSVSCDGGIRMSTITSSGCRSRTSSSSSAASPACPTTSKPDRSSRLAEALAEQDVVIGDDHAHGIHRDDSCIWAPRSRDAGISARGCRAGRAKPQPRRAKRRVRHFAHGHAIARPKLEGNVAVGDDRQIGFAEFGDPQGRAVFWLHGTPGARRQIPVEARAYAERKHIRLIGVDRPGIGSSTPYQYPNVLAFADDLRTIADVLGIDEMASSGSPAAARTRWPARRRCPTASWSRASSAAWPRRSAPRASAAG